VGGVDLRAVDDQRRLRGARDGDRERLDGVVRAIAIEGADALVGPPDVERELKSPANTGSALDRPLLEAGAGDDGETRRQRAGIDGAGCGACLAGRTRSAGRGNLLAIENSGRARRKGIRDDLECGAGGGNGEKYH